MKDDKDEDKFPHQIEHDGETYVRTTKGTHIKTGLDSYHYELVPSVPERLCVHIENGHLIVEED